MGRTFRTQQNAPDSGTDQSRSTALFVPLIRPSRGPSGGSGSERPRTVNTVVGNADPLSPRVQEPASAGIRSTPRPDALGPADLGGDALENIAASLSQPGGSGIPGLGLPALAELPPLEEMAGEQYVQGYAVGRSAAHEVLGRRLASVELLVEALTTARKEMLTQVKEDIVSLLCRIPQRILRQSVQVSPQTLSTLLGAILEDLPRQERIVVKVCPEDRENMVEALSVLEQRGNGQLAIQIEPSPYLERGGLVVEMDGGRIDASISRQMEIFEERIRECLQGPAAQGRA